jgi:proton-dependent oligopeptide transporter, POT family
MKTPSQPRAIYYVVAIANLGIFQLLRHACVTHSLSHPSARVFNDTHAFSLYSAYASLVYVTPIIGGLLADQIVR